MQTEPNTEPERISCNTVESDITNHMQNHYVAKANSESEQIRWNMAGIKQNHPNANHYLIRAKSNNIPYVLAEAYRNKSRIREERTQNQ